MNIFSLKFKNIVCFVQIQSELEQSFLKRVIFNLALRAKESDLKKNILRRNTIWDILIFRKVQQNLGGNLRLMVVGSAPLAENVLTFARCTLGCLVLEGYGQTECCAPITITVQVFFSFFSLIFYSQIEGLFLNYK